jgi:surfeit locus 1 family protein
MSAMAALGVWQLDRLEQRRAFNQMRRVALAAPPIELTDAPLPPGDLRDRQAVAIGEFDYARQVAIRNQSHVGQPGYHLVTPLRIAGAERAVLVNRGWIPHDQANPTTWRIFDEQQEGPQIGLLQPTRRRPDGAVSAIPQDIRTGWYRLDVEAIGQTMPYKLLPVVLQLTPAGSPGAGDGRSRPATDPNVLPHRVEHDLAFSEGNHLSYALQWFGFAMIAAIVYVSIVRRAAARDA